jgi:hypothetical protein
VDASVGKLPPTTDAAPPPQADTGAPQFDAGSLLPSDAAGGSSSDAGG